MRLVTGMFLLFTAATVGLPGACAAELHASTVEYAEGETVLEGYLAYDDSFAGRRPGILVVHEWTGLGEYVKGRCEQLAGLGYVAFGADIYGKGVRPRTHEEAAEVSGMYVKDRTLMRARVKAGLEKLRSEPHTDPARLAAIGYCFGGVAALELARSGADIKAVVTFHGMLSNPDPKNAKNIRASVLVNTGADDPAVDQEQVDAFMEEMRKTDVDWRLIMYGGTVHSFTVPEAGDDPSKGIAYNETADRRSWRAMLELFDEAFK